MKKAIILYLIGLILIISGSFYGGMKYQESKIPFRRAFPGLSPEQRQQFAQQRTEGGIAFLSGEVIAKDEQSLTLKMPDGSSKIIFFSDSIQISKTTEGSIKDIEIGKQIIVSGSKNADGSYTAKTIQLPLPYSNKNR